MYSQDFLDELLIWAAARLELSGDYQVQVLNGGFSGDFLWLLKTESGPMPLLRVVESSKAARLKRSFEALCSASALEIPVNAPLFCEEYGDDVCVMASAYIPGEDGGQCLPKWGTDEAAVAGKSAGKMLRNLHDIPSEDDSPASWAKRRILKYERYQEEAYRQGLSFSDQDRVEGFLEERLGSLARASISFQHDDFHPRNLIFREKQLVGVIDFDNCDSGDPIEDFYKLPWFTFPISEAFARGQIEGYLEVDPVERFWERYNIAVAMSLASSLVWVHRRQDRKMMFNFQHRIMEIVNTHDFTDGGPPTWF